MNPPTTTQRSPAHPSRPVHQRVRRVHVLTALAIAAGLVMLQPLVKAPRFVSRMTFQNPTAYDLSVEVSGAGHDGWMPASFAARRSTTAATEIYDIGDVWIFRFSAQGEMTSELRVTRAQLEHDRWRVQIPARIGDELRDLGASPPP